MKKIALLASLLFLSIELYAAENVLVEEVKFESHSVSLSGSIVFPVDQEIQAAVVFVHGSGPQTRNLHWAERFAAEGIAALVYDKRGVGKSGGAYEAKQSVSEKNLNLLADDALAALGTLKNHPQTQSVTLGLAGISQAGWIVPLAAEKSDAVDFLAIWSGPVCKISEEDIFSKYTADLDKERVPSYEEALMARKTTYRWPAFLGKNTDSSENLSKLDIPGIWVFGEKDGSIPVDLSMQKLSRLIDHGHSYEYVLFSGYGHNNMTETFSTVTDWINRLP